MSNTPSTLKFTLTHEWLKQDHEEMTIGITDHAQQLLGDMVYVDLPKIGATITAGDELGVVESVKAASDFYSPISGVVTALNEKACEDPSIVNRDPYGQGWLVKIKANNLTELESLLDLSQYQNETAED